MPTNSKSTPSLRWLLVGSGLLLLPLTMLGLFVPSFRLIWLSCVSIAVMLVPLATTQHKGKADWFSPWNWLFYFAFLSVLLRAIYITFDFPDDFTIRSTFLGRESKEFLIGPMVVVLLGLSCLTLGYLMGPKDPRKISLRIFQADRWNDNRMAHVFFALLGLSWMGFYLFITNTSGSLDLENLSATRGLTTDLTQYASYGYFRWMINLSDLSCLLVVARMASARRINRRDLIIFVLSLLTSLSYYYYVQTRSGIIVVAVNLLAIGYYLYGRKHFANRRFPIKKALMALPAALFIFRWMTILRPGSGFSDVSWYDLSPLRSLDPLVINTNGIDVSKTAHIMGAVGRQLDFEWGWTLLNVFFIWIPRQVWPDKPTNVDTTIGMTVFGAETYGAGAVPPGMIAEMYWNFWIPGVIIGCFLLGYFLRVVFTHFSAYSDNRNVVLWYVLAFMPLGAAFMGSGFSSALISFMMTSIPVVIVLHYITMREAVARPCSPGSQQSAPPTGF